MAATTYQRWHAPSAHGTQRHGCNQSTDWLPTCKENETPPQPPRYDDSWLRTDRVGGPAIITSAAVMTFLLRKLGPTLCVSLSLARSPAYCERERGEPASERATAACERRKYIPVAGVALVQEEGGSASDGRDDEEELRQRENSVTRHTTTTARLQKYSIRQWRSIPGWWRSCTLAAAPCPNELPTPSHHHISLARTSQASSAIRHPHLQDRRHDMAALRNKKAATECWLPCHGHGGGSVARLGAPGPRISASVGCVCLVGSGTW